MSIPVDRTVENRIDPEHIAVSKSKGIEIDWADGLHSKFSVEFLREHCPCATCTGAHGNEPQKWTPDQSPFPMFKPRIKMESIEAVGNYALRIFWNDGHKTGLYSYDYLRQLAVNPPADSVTKA